MSSPKVVRKTIYIVGPSSTGKTTLCNALAKKLGLQEKAITTEIAREVMRTHGYTRKDVGSLEMQETIMEAHLKREMENEEICGIQIYDRSAVDPVVYAVLTSADEEEARKRKDILVNSPNFQQVLETYRRSYFILLAPVSEWLKDDGVRLVENQMQCMGVFRDVLKELEINFQTMGNEMKILEERMSVVMGRLRL